jgi:fructokinase
MTILSIGEVLWDVFPDGERLGGAPLNLAAHARKLGHDVVFASAVGNDDRGRRALTEMEALGISTANIRKVEDRPTGFVSIRLTSGQPDYTIHRPAAYDAVAAPSTVKPDWICFGTLLAMNPDARAVVHRTVEAHPKARKFYDVNLRRDSWTPELVRELISLAHVVKVNEDEAAIIDTRKVGRICITRGERGCTLRFEGESVHVPGTPIKVVDAVGAGDAWSAAFLHGYGAGWPLPRIGEFANRLGALVAGRRGAVPEWSMSEIK